jgi:hypothetical protein
LLGRGERHVLIAGTGGGGYLLARTGKRWLTAREQVAADDDRHGGFSEPWKTAVDMRRDGINETAAAFNARRRRQHRKPSPSRRYRLSCSDDEARDDDDGYEWGEDDGKDKERSRLLPFPVSYARTRVPVCLVNPSPNYLTGALCGLPSDGVSNHWRQQLSEVDLRACQLPDPAGGLARSAGW